MNDREKNINRKRICLFVMDVDGTLTDGKIYMSTRGELFKAFDIKDGCGIKDILPKAGIMPIVITGRVSKIVENRCLELGVTHCYQGCRDKAAKLREVADWFNLIPDESGVYEEIAYIGDDINDMTCMKLCGIVGCPADAVVEIKQLAVFVSSKKGGEGAVRDFINYIINL